MQRRRRARGLYPRGDSLRPYILCQPTPMEGKIRAASAAAHQIKNRSTKKDAYVGVFFDTFSCSGRGRGSPLCRTPAGGGESVHIFRGRKRVLVLGKVRADGALTRRVSAAGCCTAQSASVPCAFRDAVGCFGHCVLHGEVWWRSLPPAPRSSALRHGPPMPRRGAGVVFEFSSQGVSIPCFGLCVRIHTEGVCSLFVHLHLNREWNPCPCRSSRYFGASFPFSPLPPLTRSPSPLAQGRLKWRDIRFPRRCGGSGARSEPKGAPLFSLLPFQCLDDLREGGAIAAEDAFNEAAFGAVFAEGRHHDRELQRVVNLHIEERLVKRTGRIRCRF